MVVIDRETLKLFPDLEIIAKLSKGTGIDIMWEDGEEIEPEEEGSTDAD